jgi:sugar phosphate permease
MRTMTTADSAPRNSHVRFWIIAVLFVVSSINYASRATLSFAAVPLGKEIQVSTVELGYIFSAFGWSYVIGQIPGGALLDRYGSRPIYLWSITLWAVFTMAQAFVSSLAFIPVFVSLFALRFALGFAESPSFPANARIVANWFPNAERGTASAIFNASQYFSLVAFAPLMGWLAQYYGWRSVFLAMGLIGLVGAALFWALVESPSRHKSISKQEYDYIEAGGALVNLDRPAAAPQPIRWGIVGQLLANRMLLGIYLAQYCITALTYFYATWFPIYLVKARHMTLAHAGFAAAGPAIAGFVGGVLGGVISDLLLKRGTPPGDFLRHPVLQLHRQPVLDHAVHVHRLLRQGHCGAGLGGDERCGAARGHRPFGQHLQPVRQCRRHLHAHRHRLYPGRHQQQLGHGAGFRLRPFHRRHDQLCLRHRPDQARGAQDCIGTRL